MASQGSDEELMLEFEVMIKRAGLDVPEQRKAAVFAGYKDLKRLCALLRQPRSAASEPSNTYSLVTLMKGA
jgi:hypothetical protein